MAWLDLALAALNEGVLVAGDDMKVLFANDAIAQMVNTNRIFILGAPIWEVLPLCVAGKPLTSRHYLTALKKSNLRSLNGLHTIKSATRSTMVELTVEHIARTKQTIFVVRDVTERLEAQAQRIRAAQEQAARKSAEASQKRLLTQYKVASVLAESPDLEKAASQILEVVCRNLGWQVGGLWTPDSAAGKLRCLRFWHVPGEQNRQFSTVSKQHEFNKGEGLPGRVWQEGTPVWLTDVSKELNFPRVKAAGKLGLHGAFAFPLIAGQEFMGVMEFFSDRSQKPDEELLTGMSTVGSQVAQFMRRKEVEQALRQSEERLRFMADSMPQKIFTTKPDGEADYFNPEFMAFTGLNFEQISKWGWIQFIHPDDRDENIRYWQHSVDTGEPFQMEHRFRRADGVYRWHLSRARALRDNKGKILMWIGSSTDIEDLRRKLELEEITATLRREQALLISLNNAKDEFIALASHQLRTPATGVKQFLGMLSDGYAGTLTKDQASLAEMAYEANERQISIIDDLLKVARVDAGKVMLKKEKADLVSLIKNVLDEQQAQFTNRDQKVTYTHSNKTLTAHVDAERLRMVLDNLIDNASKYTPASKNIAINLKKDERMATIEIMDEGVGIKAADIDKLFQKFKRLDNPLSVSVGGTGLGLYWAKKIVDLHDGSITVKSRPNRGSTFTVTLPC